MATDDAGFRRVSVMGEGVLPKPLRWEWGSRRGEGGWSPGRNDVHLGTGADPTGPTSGSFSHVTDLVYSTRG